MKNQILSLAPEAVFPICFDEHGNKCKQKPATGFNIAGTLQGEGKMAGIPVLFLRTSGCNLRCLWALPNGEVSLCDTPLASFDTREQVRKPVDSIKNLIVNNMGNMNHLVISGGEPLLQAGALIRLLSKLKKERPVHISVETNGTLFHPELAEHVDFFSISPKLKNSVPTAAKLEKLGLSLPADFRQMEMTRKNLTAIQAMIDHCVCNPGKDFQLKFVVQSHDELAEVEETFLSQLKNWKPDDVVLMPLGSTPAELQQTRMLTLEAAISRGWRYSPRLQINYFNGIAGV
jgi:7-carboxy-7-deazaguanine synthase